MPTEEIVAATFGTKPNCESVSLVGLSCRTAARAGKTARWDSKPTRRTQSAVHLSVGFALFHRAVGRFLCRRAARRLQVPCAFLLHLHQAAVAFPSSLTFSLCPYAFRFPLALSNSVVSCRPPRRLS